MKGILRNGKVIVAGYPLIYVQQLKKPPEPADPEIQVSIKYRIAGNGLLILEVAQVIRREVSLPLVGLAVAKVQSG